MANSLLTGGGTDSQCLRLMEGLARRGHDVRLAGPRTAPLSPQAMAVNPIFPAPRRKISFIHGLFLAINTWEPDIVHSHHGRDYWPHVIARRLAIYPSHAVMTRHLAKSPGSWLGRNFLLSQCDAMIAVSDSVAEILREGHDDPASPEAERHQRLPMRGDHDKIRTILPGIDLSRYQPGESLELRKSWGLEPRHYAFAVAGGYELPRGKGQREFLKAAALIHKQLPDARFLIIGNGTMKQILEEDIASLGLGEKVRMIPYVKDMPPAMNAIDCLVHPQIGTEAFGLVICEAHACGKPVIASALDGIPEAFDLGGEGQLVLPEDIDALAAAMRMQAAVPPLSMEARRKLHAKVAELCSVERLAEETEALYAEVMGDRKAERPEPDESDDEGFFS
jgi:glycosyltransferase involved in cell wall biosynthesis